MSPPPVPAALAAAGALAAALADPFTVEQQAEPSSRAWPQSLAGGAAGIALLHIERARAGHGDWDTARAWLSAATRDTLTAAPNAGLFTGVPALAFAVHAAAGNTGSYQRALARLDAATGKLTSTRLRQAQARIDRGDQPLMSEFDLIRGLAGFGTYHLRRHPGHPVTRDVLGYLVRLTCPLPGTGQDSVPPWWTGVSPSGDPDPAYPGGHGNLGMSHGISSVLSLLAISVLADRPVPGTADAIAAICAWTDRWRQHHSTATWWPGLVTAEQHQAGHVDAAQRPRPSWCYGIGGTARAQQLAGLALGDTHRQHEAENAMLAVLRDPGQVSRLPQAGLCHGTAGLLQSAWRMAADASTPQIAAEIPALATRLIHAAGDAVTFPEFLDGAAGAALALHTAGTGTAPASSWDSVLLLALTHPGAASCPARPPGTRSTSPSPAGKPPSTPRPPGWGRCSATPKPAVISRRGSSSARRHAGGSASSPAAAPPPARSSLA